MFSSSDMMSIRHFDFFFVVNGRYFSWLKRVGTLSNTLRSNGQRGANVYVYSVTMDSRNPNIYWRAKYVTANTPPVQSTTFRAPAEVQRNFLSFERSWERSNAHGQDLGSLQSAF
jgi:hypothetical protein